MKLFKLDIYTPEKLFLSTEAESIMVSAPDGKLGILADHTLLVAPLIVGTMTIRTPEGVREAFNSEGFIEVAAEGVRIFCQACEWPEDIDVNRAEEAKRRAQNRIDRQNRAIQFRANKISLARAMERLKVGKNLKQ